MEPPAHKPEKSRPPKASTPLADPDPHELAEISFREARARLESSVQHVIELQRRRQELARNRHA